MQLKRIDIACIIDDDPIFVFGVKKVMEVVNFCKDVVVYKNGQDAINGLKSIVMSNEKIPDVILLDLNMPVLDGWQFLDEFTTIPCPKKITIYIASSSVDPHDLVRAKRHNLVRNYIVKPISIDKLKVVLEDLEYTN